MKLKRREECPMCGTKQSDFDKAKREGMLEGAEIAEAHGKGIKQAPGVPTKLFNAIAPEVTVFCEAIGQTIREAAARLGGEGE